MSKTRYFFGAALVAGIAVAFSQVMTPLPDGMAPKVNHGMGQVNGTRHGPILPWTGLYSDPDQSGSGLSVDMGREGMMFISFGTFDDQGRQENLLAQPLYKPTSNRERHDTGVIGRATAEFFRVRNGQTPGGAHREPDYEATGLVAELEWTAPRRMTMSFGTHTYQWQGNNYDGRNDGAFMEGRWAAATVFDEAPYRRPYAQGEPSRFYATAAVLDIKRLNVPLSSIVPPSSSVFDAERHFPRDGDELYLVTCAPPLEGQRYQSEGWCAMVFDGFGRGAHEKNGTNRALLWYNPGTGVAGGASLRSQPGSLEMWAPREMAGYITPNEIRIRVGRPDYFGKSDYLDRALTLIRLPNQVKMYDFDPNDTESGCTNCD